MAQEMQQAIAVSFCYNKYQALLNSFMLETRKFTTNI